MNKFKLSLNYGTAAGLVSFVIFILVYLAFSSPLEYAQWLMFWVPVVGIYLLIKKYRDEINGGFISFGNAFQISGVFGLIYSSFVAIAIYLFVWLVDGSIFEKFKNSSVSRMEEQLEKMGDSGFTKVLEQAIAEIEKMTLESFALSQFYNRIFWTIFLSLVMAAIMKKKQNPFEAETEKEEEI